MALIKEIETDAVVLSDGQIQVRNITIIKEDGVELSRSYHRHVIDVGGDTTAEPQIVQDIAGAVHTQSRINARALYRSNNPRIG